MSILNNIGMQLLTTSSSMSFFTESVGVLQTLVIALGAGLAIWGGVNLMEGYGADNRATRS